MNAGGASLPKLKELAAQWFENYKNWIVRNPNLTSDLESTIKYFSFYTAGRLSNSNFVSELIYSLPNLLILFNDHLLRITWNPKPQIPSLQSKLKIWLTIIDYTEALFELTAKRVWGEVGRWLIIGLIQLLKVTMRLLLVFRFKDRIIPTPPIQPLNRDKLFEIDPEQQPKEAFQLKRSGKIIRTVRSSSTTHRTWKPPSSVDQSSQDDPSSFNVQSFKTSIVLAETMYILKPLLHLGCLSMSGPKNWNPWLLSFVIDLASLHIYKQETTLTREEREELCRRRIGLLLYLLRSPFYDNCSRMRIFSLLEGISRTVPFSRLVTEPIARYLPHWQNTYFYMWSS